MKPPYTFTKREFLCLPFQVDLGEFPCDEPFLTEELQPQRDLELFDGQQLFFSIKAYHVEIDDIIIDILPCRIKE